MASVFTYDPNPPRISSPWPPATAGLPAATQGQVKTGEGPSAHPSIGGLPAPRPCDLAGLDVAALDPEPQEGPIEYKVHLLLRPRRALAACSTGQHVSGSNASGHLSGSGRSSSSAGNPLARASHGSRTASPLPSPSLQTRENRLQHLTTQLLWRLQQSSPFHSASGAKLVPPTLPELSSSVSLSSTPSIAIPRPGPLLPGLGESRGALYEIGVGDDGAFVGLAQDEMDESVFNLRAMASSLGCGVDIRRFVKVGHCQRHASASVTSPHQGAGGDANVPGLFSEPLWVVEALVSPSGSSVAITTEFMPASPLVESQKRQNHDTAAELAHEDVSRIEQLRVALTGATASGKSSLLGTLSTSTLDNGRGKSRLSLLKHHHEIRSGRTSSVALELLGYRPTIPSERGPEQDMVVNYGLSDISSWNDIHHQAEGGRLVFFTDSAGHFRYKRTMMRSLVSWRPHWVACCVAADSALATTEGGADLTKAHLELCLHLELPLVVVVTKTDIASASLRANLSYILSLLRAADRSPVLLSPSRKTSMNHELQIICPGDEAEVQAKLSGTAEPTRHKIVPVVLTSAVTGAGMGQLHALLRELPMPEALSAHRSKSGSPMRFHIDEIYVRTDHPSSTKPSDNDGLNEDHTAVVLSGLLCLGSLSISDTIRIGPFSPDEQPDAPILRTHSFPNHLDNRLGSQKAQRLDFHESRRRSDDCLSVSADPDVPPRKSYLPGEWLAARVLSIRNLRLPRRTLLASQAGTVGISVNAADAASIVKLRKGMVLVDLPGRYAGGSAGVGFCARFAERDYRVMEPGALCQVFVRSVRALAKIVTVEAVAASLDADPAHPGGTENEGMFMLDEPEDGRMHYRETVQSETLSGQIDVAFRFVHFREWVELGSHVVVMPGNAVEGSVGLNAFVGRVTSVEP